MEMTEKTAKLTIKDELDGKVAVLELIPGRSYTIFVDPCAIDLDQFMKARADSSVDIDAVIIPVLRRPGMSVAESLAAQERGE